MLIFFALNFIVTINSLYFTKIFAKDKGGADFYLTWFVSYLILILSVELILGLAQLLTLANIAIFHSGISSILILSGLTGKLNQPIPKLDILFIRNSKILLWAIAVFVSFFLVKIWVNLYNPVLGADSMMYHLTLPATWIQNANLNNPMIIFGPKANQAPVNAVPYYPINAEFFFLWLMLPLKNAFLADLGEAPFYIAGILALYCIMRKLKVAQQASLLLALLWALIPNCLKQIQHGSYVDIICATFFFIFLNYILDWEKEFNFKNSFLVGLAFGLFVGTKTLNVVWSTALFPLIAYILIEQIRTKKTVILPVVWLLVGALLLGAYPYVRNFILTRNIFYPVTITLLGHKIMPGTISRLDFANLTYPMKDFTLRNMFFGEGLGVQLLLFAFPATLLPLCSIIFIKRLKAGTIRNICLFSIPTILLGLYLFYMRSFWTRYLYSYLGMGLVISGAFLSNFKWGEKYTTICGLIAIFASIGELSRHTYLIVSIIFAILIFLFFLYLRNNNFDRRKFRKFSIASLIIAGLYLSLLNQDYDRSEYDRYLQVYPEKDVAYAWKWLNENTGRGKNIAYTGRNEFYPLLGKYLKNRVSYVSLNSTPSIPHLYPDGDYRRVKDQTAWIKNIIRQKSDYLFIYLPYEEEDFPIENKWAEANPQIFKLLLSNSKIRIYKCYFETSRSPREERKS